MKKVGKPVFFIVLAFILFLSYTAIFGVSTQYADLRTVYFKGAGDIRFGIDMRGGIDATFAPADGVDVSDEDLAAAEQIIKVRLVNNNITDYEVYPDYQNDRIIVRYPWSEDETEFNPEEAIKELGETAELTFRYGDASEIDEDGNPIGELILSGDSVAEAYPAVVTDDNGAQQIIVSLSFKEEGIEAFSDATTELAGTDEPITIWMDNTAISTATVNEAITDGQASIEGSDFTAQYATELASRINAGALPFEMEAASYNTISPTLGSGAQEAMVMAGIIAFILVCAYVIFMYRLPGVIASIALLGQVAGTLAAVSGYFAVFPSFTLTLPGIAGIILAVGIGVDANIIAASRIREEIRAGKTIDGSVNSGFKKAFSAVFDGNITIAIIAVILMGAFGPPGSFFTNLLTPIFFMFGPSTAGAVYSFGYTLLVGVLLNFIMGVGASRLMLKSASRFKFLRKPGFYGRGLGKDV